nr:hypothetical protein [Morchella crassipes]
MRGVEGGRGSDHLIILMAASPPFYPPLPACYAGSGGGRGRKDSKTSLQFPQQPILSLHKSSSLMALGAKREEERRPSPPPHHPTLRVGPVGVRGPGKGWLGKPLPPRKDEEGGWDGKWREGERGGAASPLPHSPPPPPNPFIFYRRSTGLGGRSSDPPSFHNMGIPPEHKAKGGDPQVWKEGGGEREEGER